jgi:hypothetical protein
MSTIPYTEEEWNHLIRQGVLEAGQALGGDLASWRPKIERICARHGLAVAGEMQWKYSGAAFRGPNSVFLLGDLAVKVFARRSPIWFQREVEALRVLGDVPEAKTPRLLAYGDAISEEDPTIPISSWSAFAANRMAIAGTNGRSKRKARSCHRWR